MKKQRIQKAFKKWAWLVNGYGWQFTVKYVMGTENMPDGCTATTTAATRSSWEYLEGFVYVNLIACEDEPDDAIERMVIHELVHMIVSPVETETKENEYVVTSLERIIYGMRKQ